MLAAFIPLFSLVWAGEADIKSRRCFFSKNVGFLRENGWRKGTDSLSRIFKRAQQSDSLSQLGPALDSCYQTHFLSCRAFLEELIENNLDDLAVLPVFYQRVGTRAFFSESADADLLRRIQSHLNRAYPGNTHILSLNERLEK